MAKVLQRLVRRGCWLAAGHARRLSAGRGAVQISVADVIQAIDGPVTVTACSTDEGQCEQFSKCNVRDPLYRVRERILAALGECTIAELAADPRRRRPRVPRCCIRICDGSCSAKA
jgi:DNA-binding IscR family transcriptional regulator